MIKRRIIIEKKEYSSFVLKTKQLKVLWNLEMVQDLQKKMSFDSVLEIEKELNKKNSYKRVLLIEKRCTQIKIENELVSILSQEIARTIDQEIMNQIIREYGF
jgi:predicted metal-binding protein